MLKVYLYRYLRTLAAAALHLYGSSHQVKYPFNDGHSQPRADGRGVNVVVFLRKWFKYPREKLLAHADAVVTDRDPVPGNLIRGEETSDDKLYSAAVGREFCGV